VQFFQISNSSGTALVVEGEGYNGMTLKHVSKSEH
jgi:hypothetical protein